MELDTLLDKMARGENLDALERLELRQKMRALEEVRNLAQSWVFSGTSIPIFQPPMVSLYSKKLSVTTPSIAVPIPSAYSHIFILGNGRTTHTGNVAENILVQFNGDTGANYDTETIFRLNNSSSGAQNLANTAISIGTFATADADAGASGNCIAFIPNYASPFFKGATGIGGGYFTGAAGAIVFTDFGQWENTGIITSLTLLPEAGSFAADTTISVYGLI